MKAVPDLMTSALSIHNAAASRKHLTTLNPANKRNRFKFLQI